MTRTRTRQILVVLACAAAGAARLAAQGAPAAPATSPDLSSEAVVIEREALARTYDADGSMAEDQEERVRVQSAAGVERMGTIVLPFSRELDTLEVRYVRVRKPDGTTVETPVTSAIDVPADVTREAPIYSDIYLRQINVQGLAAGDTIEYAVHKRERSLVPGAFYFEHGWNDEVLSKDTELRVSVPADRAVIVKSADPQPVVSSADGRRTYVWHRVNLTHPSETEAAIRAYESRIRPAAIQMTSFRDWPEVGEAIRALWTDRAEVTPAIRDKARELTRTATSDDARLRAIYGFVSSQVRYVAIALGIGRIRPRTAAEVMTTGFGDCKDKHTLLVALLRAVGIEADAVLIAADDGPTDRDVPSLASFNHVITYVPSLGGGTWLDATAEVLPMGLLIWPERDRDALRIPSAGAAAIVHVPAAPSRANEWTTDLDGVVDGAGVLTATVKETFSGDSEVVARVGFRSIARTDWPKLAAQLSVGRRFGGTATDVVITPPEDTSGPFQVSYRYTRPTPPDWANRDVSALIPYAGLPDIGDADPPVPFELGAPPLLRRRTISRIELPTGYDVTIKDATADRAVDNDVASSHVRSVIAGRVFTAEREVVTKVTRVNTDQVGAYRAILKNLADIPAVTLHAIRPWKWGDAATIGWYAGASPAAMDTMRAAVTASGRGDGRTAIDLLRGLTQSDPNNASAGVMLGWALFQAGDSGAAVGAVRDQMARTPTPSGYKLLAQRLASAGRRDEAIQAWQQGRDRFPNDREMPLYLGESLVEAKRFAEAIPVLRGVADANAASPRLFWNLGRAYAGAGQPDEAVAAFSHAAEADGSPNALNTIAWQMAESKVGLDAAQGFARRAVEATEADAERLTLATLDAAALKLTSSLAAYWDTLAWIDFRRGDTAAALRYMQPAWDLGQSGVFAEHLAEMLDAEGDHDRAAAYYARALAADAPDASAAARLMTLVPGASERSALVTRAPAALAADRTVAVPRVAGVDGHADVFVSVGSNGAVEDARFISGDDALRVAVGGIRAATMPSRLPGDALTHVVRRGTLTCSTGADACALVLAPAARVTRVD